MARSHDGPPDSATTAKLVEVQEAQEKPRGALFLIRDPRNGKYLLEKRDGNCRYFPHQWNFPGEHRTETEEAEDAAVRGAEEEFGLALSKDGLVSLTLHKQPHAEGHVKVFTTELPEGQEPEHREGAAMGWFSLEEIRQMKLGFGHDALVPLLEA